MEFIVATRKEEFDTGKALFLEYIEQLGIDLSFQNLEEELSTITTQYGAPSGGLILLKEANEAVGCVGIRKFEPQVAEVKRMFIQPAFRSRGMGKPLLSEAIQLARSLNYCALRLDTLPFMRKAITLYHAMGFREIEPYRYNPIEGTRYFELDLTTAVVKG